MPYDFLLFGIILLNLAVKYDKIMLLNERNVCYGKAYYFMEIEGRI